MATSNKDRRAVVEQLRREQQRAERRRTIAVVGACAVVALVIVGLVAVPLLRRHQAASGPLSSLGATPSAAGCQPLLKKKATGNQEHRAEGIRIDYADAPPAFGPHYPTPAPISRNFYTAGDRPAVPYVVHNLEHGYTLLWYDDTVGGDADQLAVVRGIAEKFTGTEMTDKFIALPWTSKDGHAFPGGAHVALTHWSAGGTGVTAVARQRGVWQYCAQPSGAAVETFMKAYPFSDSPEPGAA